MIFLIIQLISLVTTIHCQSETTTTQTPTTSEVVTTTESGYSIFDDPRCVKPCILKNSWLDSGTMKSFPKNCSTICAPDSFQIDAMSNLNESTLIGLFKNLKVFIGAFSIYRTNLKNAKFLENLETVECDLNGAFQVKMNLKMTEIGLPNLKMVSCRFFVEGNSNLTKLNLPNLKVDALPSKNWNSSDIWITGNHPDFCISLQEMQNLLTSDKVQLTAVVGNYCAIPQNTNFTSEKLCDIDNMPIRSLDQNCTFVKGEVKIKSGEEAEVEKLRSVKKIYGNLYITGTQLQEIDFFDNLEEVITIKDETPSILVDFNKNLTDYEFPKLKRVQTTIHVGVQFNNNTEDLMMKPEMCYKFMNQSVPEKSYTFRIDGDVCEYVARYALQHKPQDNSENGMYFLSVVLIVLLQKLWFF